MAEGRGVKVTESSMLACVTMVNDENIRIDTDGADETRDSPPQERKASTDGLSCWCFARESRKGSQLLEVTGTYKRFRIF